MVNVKDIIDGHIKELFSINDELSVSRLKICYSCPLFKNMLGGICNSDLWLNPDTEDVSTMKKPGYIRGCGCRLKSKTRLPNAMCIAGKW